MQCDILERLAQAFSGETMAHEARVRAHLSRMEHSLYNLPRQVRQRTDDGQGNATTTSTLQADARASLHDAATSSHASVELTAIPRVDEVEEPSSEGGPPITHMGEATANLSPDSCYTDTLSSAEGGNLESQPLLNHGEGEPAFDGEGDAAAHAEDEKTQKGISRTCTETGWIDGILFLGNTTAPAGYTTGKGERSLCRRTTDHPQGQAQNGGGLSCQESEEEGEEEEEAAPEETSETPRQPPAMGGNRPLHCWTMRRSSAGKSIIKN